MRSLAVLSMHTSPLAQPGTGDGGGMNVHVRELSTALARAGVACEVFTRAWSEDLPATVAVEPGLRVHHVPAGPLAPIPKEGLPEVIEEFSEGVLCRLTGGTGRREEGVAGSVDAIHANYWLSGIAGDTVKHELNLPLVSTFHTLARVKAEASPAELAASEPAKRAEAEARIIGCSDAVLATCSVEAVQLAQLYGADPSRICIVPPGVDRAFFAPGNRSQARRALGLPDRGSMLVFVGRIQPLKGADVAVAALARLDPSLGAFLVVVGGPSGPQGNDEMRRLHLMVKELGVEERVHFVAPQAHELLSTYYRAADACLVPSRSESFGLVALESAACGTPVVASAVGGLRTIVDQGRTGFLVEERAPQAFAEHMTTLLCDPVRRARMSEMAAARARNYTWPKAGAILRRLYQELTDRVLVECH